MKKLILTFAVVATAVTAWGAESASLKKFVLPTGFTSSLSDNGKWGTWQPASGDETDAVVSLLNVSTGKIDQLPLDADQTAAGYVARTNDVSDDGRIVVGSFNGQAAYYKDGRWTELPMPDGKRKWNGQVTSVTPDGRVMVGVISQAMTLFEGIVWIDGQIRSDIIIPTHQEMYDLGIIDKSTLDDHIADKRVYPNSYFFSVSSDGKKILVGLDHNYPAWGACYIVYDLDSGKYQWIRTDGLKGDWFIDEAMMSNNGKWVGGYAVTEGMPGFEEQTTYRFDVENGKFEYMPDIVRATVIDNKGRFLCAPSADGVVSNLCVPSGGLMVDLPQILRQKYDMDFTELTGWSTTGYAMGIDDSGKTILAMAQMRESAYSLTLPVDFWEAAAGVNLLDQWAAIPAPGSEMSQVKNLVVYLSNQADLDKTKSVTIFCGDSKVAETKNITKANNTGSAWRFTFDNLIFEEGKTYDVVVPEGLFIVEGSASKSPEMRYSYKGRKNAPVAPVTYAPEPGSAVVEFSMTNPMTITFDTDLTLNPEAMGEYFKKGSDKPVGKVALGINGRTLYAYPVASVKLFEGTDYTFKFPADAVRDVAGFCGNEAFDLTFSGAYQTPPPSPGHPFQNDFNDPNDALSKFLQYEGDHRTPTDEMAAFGFDADNTPWNFSIRDDGAYDYCAASHSMYNPAGKSDDWLVIPQLAIDNEHTVLSFDAQSYLKGKKDVLKVLVWKCDERYNTLSSEVVKRMRDEGTVIFEQQLTPGATEGTLADEWQNVSLPLSAFKGSNIYIAFVNENENQSMIFIDNIDVCYEGRYMMGANVPETVVAADEMTFKAFVTAGSSIEKPFSHIEASVESLTTGAKSTYAADVNIEADKTYEFTFPDKISLKSGASNEYRLTVSLDGEKQSISGQVLNLSEDFPRTVLVEEGTGSWCGNCPKGMLCFDYLEKAFPGKIVPVAVHNGDRLAYLEYDQFLSLGGYPAGRVNRNATVTLPMGDEGFLSSSGNETWTDHVIKELDIPAMASVSIDEARVSTSSLNIEMKATVKFGIERTGVNYNVFVVALEKGIPGSQHNYYYNMEDPIYGEWGASGTLGAQGQYASVEYGHVARGIAGNSFYGINGLLPKDVKPGEDYKVSVVFNRPQTVLENANLSLACVIIDAATGKVLNADSIHELQITDAEINGIDSISSEGADVRFTSFSGTVYANGESDGVEVYTLQGARVANEGLSGLYIVRASDGNGGVATAKMIVK